MLSKEWDFSDVSYGGLLLSVLIDGEEIESFIIPARHIEDKTRDSINRAVEYFEYSGTEYKVLIESSALGTHISIEADAEYADLDDFELQIDEVREEAALSIKMYVPTSPYTPTLSSALYSLADSDSVIPMIDMENDRKFSDYLEDDLINYKHFLDLTSMKFTVNQAERERAKEARKEERRTDKDNVRTILPKVDEKPFDIDGVVDHFLKIERIKRINIIPVYLWDERATKADLIYFFSQLDQAGFGDFAVRVLDKNTFIQHSSELKEIHDFIILLDFNTNFNIENIAFYVSLIQSAGFSRIVYLGAHFMPNGMTLSRDECNENIIRQNYPIIVYENLCKEFTGIGYGDYCGFDRKTLTAMPKGGRPSARVVLHSLDGSRKILIRRGWDEKDRTVSLESGKEQIRVINSMKRLLCDIQKGRLDRVPAASGDLFIDENICDADMALKSYCPNHTTPGEVKTLCIRHNVFSIIHVYMQRVN